MTSFGAPEKITRSLIRKWLKARPKDAHKGDFGHVLIVAGSRGMAGAGILSAHGALRGGAGLVTLATVKSQQPAAAKHLRPEAMTLGLPESKEGSLSIKAVPEIVSFMRKRKITSLVLGPGLSRKNGVPVFVRMLLSKIVSAPLRLKAVLLDADGFLSAPNLGGLKFPLIVTPHAGEFSRFTGISMARIAADRIGTAKKFAKLNQVVCVLKGHRTVISDGDRAVVNPTGNPGMARGGSGDVLSGLIAALIENVQSHSPFYAACAGVYIHGLAGDLAAKEKTQIGMAAGDLAEKIPSAFKKILG